MQKKGGATVEATGRSVSSGSELVFVIETCQNCKEHHWNTRHDEAKYLDFFNRGRFMILFTTLTYLFYFILVATAITERMPSAVVLRNQIPKAYLPYDLYCNLIPNDDENTQVYD